MTFLVLFILLIYKKMQRIFLGDIMKKFKKNMIIYLYVFIIFTSTLPSKGNFTNLSSLKNILPGIENLQISKKGNDTEKKYSFKFIEILQNIF